jgi:predicted Zn-dependent peptidase
MYIEDVFEQCLYGNTPAGRDTIGTKQTIGSFKRQDFLGYLNSQYSINNSTVLLTGNYGNQTRAIKLVEDYFASPKFKKRGNNFKEKDQVIDKQISPKTLVHYKETDQAHISLGVRTDSYGSKDSHIVRLLAVILGGSMSSRLFINLRERQGLAYYVRTSTESYSDSGYLTTRAGVPADKIDKAVNTILKEYRKIKSQPVSLTELKRTKDLIIGRSAIQFEQSDNVAEWYAKQAVMRDTILRTEKDDKNLKIESLDEQINKIKKVNPDQIRRAAKDIFINRRLNLAVIGPFKGKKKLEKLLKI